MAKLHWRRASRCVDLYRGQLLVLKLSDLRRGPGCPKNPWERCHFCWCQTGTTCEILRPFQKKGVKILKKGGSGVSIGFRIRRVVSKLAEKTCLGNLQPT